MSSKVTLKRYALHDSPLYRLKGKGKFESVLGVLWDAVPELLVSECYRVWVNEKGREIQAPIHWMKTVHERIGNLLSRIELPAYLYSQKGRSYADNARQHVGVHPVAKTDIHRFYPSTTRTMVMRMFQIDFECAEDIAHRLADICCYKQEHLPTGSTLSGRIAFFAARAMFDEIARLTSNAGCRLTVYVDDITISGNGASKRLLGDVRKIVSDHGLNTKQKKSITYASNSPKSITGAVVTETNLRLPNIRHQKIWRTRKELQSAKGMGRVNLQRALRGRLQEAKQILGATT
jgi:Reverse transcriptase (RNA-dependent DNA polymerase)